MYDRRIWILPLLGTHVGPWVGTLVPAAPPHCTKDFFPVCMYDRTTDVYGYYLYWERMWGHG